MKQCRSIVSLLPKEEKLHGIFAPRFHKVPEERMRIGSVAVAPQVMRLLACLRRFVAVKILCRHSPNVLQAQAGP